jgi:beta-glucosidase-like glycosyl hydrolase
VYDNAVRGGGDTNCGAVFNDDAEGGAAVVEFPELLTEGLVDKRLNATLSNLFDLGLFDGAAAGDASANGRGWDNGWDMVDSDAHRQLNLEAARQSMVLLQNPTVTATAFATNAATTSSTAGATTTAADASASSSTSATSTAQRTLASSSPILPLTIGRSIAVVGYHYDASATLQV